MPDEPNVTLRSGDGSPDRVIVHLNPGNTIANVAISSSAAISHMFSNPGREFVLVEKPSEHQGAPGQPPSREIAYKPPFIWVFIVVTGITVLAVIADVILSFVVPDMNSRQSSAVATLDWAFKIGFGAILGLLGGKNI